MPGLLCALNPPVPILATDVLLEECLWVSHGPRRTPNHTEKTHSERRPFGERWKAALSWKAQNRAYSRQRLRMIGSCGCHRLGRAQHIPVGRALKPTSSYKALGRKGSAQIYRRLVYILLPSPPQPRNRKLSGRNAHRSEVPGTAPCEQDDGRQWSAWWSVHFQAPPQ